MGHTRTAICLLIAHAGLFTVLSPTTEAYVVGTVPKFLCQGQPVRLPSCGNADVVYKINSVTIITSDSQENITNSKEQCYNVIQCRRTIHGPQDSGLSKDYLYLYNWLLNRCNGKSSCDANSAMPGLLALTVETSACGNGRQQFFAGALLDVDCISGEFIPTVATPPPTTPRTTPTTPTTTTPFPVLVQVYVPELGDREKIILGVAIGIAIAILIVLLIVLYCCETYRNHKKFAKLLRMLGTPKENNDAFDDFEDYGKEDAWRDETDANPDALGEYTGVKPNEFLTLNKQDMVNTGQIMYDTHTDRANTCSTLSRNGMNSRPSGVPSMTNYGYSGTLNYETAENLELERRMAETLQVGQEYEEESSYH